MRIPDLVAVIRTLPAAQPLTDAYEARAPMGASVRRQAWYANQKEHLLGWLDEYGGPGAYGRMRGSDDPKAAYNRFQCAPGLVWLAEALGEAPDVVRRAIAGIEAAPPRGASQCKAVRDVIPWSRIAELAERHAARHPEQIERSHGVTVAATKRASNRSLTWVAGRPRSAADQDLSLWNSTFTLKE